MNDTLLRVIAARAQPLWDRITLANEDNTRLDDRSAETAERAFHSWASSLSSEGSVDLERRIAWSGWNEAAVRSALVTDFLPTEIPAWANAVAEISHKCGHCSSQEAMNTPFQASQPVPFEELLFPAILVARRRLRSRFPHATGLAPVPLLTDTAYLSLERALLLRLRDVTMKTLQMEFESTAVGNRRWMLETFGIAPGPATRDRYAAFITQHLGDGWQRFFTKYPVLARYIGIVLLYWVDSSEEFLQRLAVDLDALGETRVTGLETGLSDPHHGHRSVISVEFSSGRKWVYKPKDLELEEVFNSLLARTQGKGATLELKTPHVLRCNGYGWVEFVTYEPCAAPDAVHRYYERAGMLACILHLLRATDCHRENLIAHGEYPTLIDMETLLQPYAKSLDPSAGDATLERGCYAESIVRTGMIPRWEVDEINRVAYDTSALGGIDPQPSPVAVPRVCAINTDDMRLVYERIMMPPEKNAPLLDGIPASSCGYLDDLCNGFERMYRVFLSHRQEVLAVDGPLAELRRAIGRFIFRSTRVYHNLMAMTYDPANLGSGVTRSIVLDRLARAQLLAPEKPSAWPLLAAELAAVEQLDVPVFSFHADSTDLETEEGVKIPGYFSRSATDEIAASMERMDERDLALQLHIIKGSVIARAASSGSVPDLPLCDLPLRIPTPAELVAEACRIGDELIGRSVRDHSGHPGWLGVSSALNVNCFQMQPIGDDLYEGRSGVALFLAALAHCTGEDRYRTAALDALRFVCSMGFVNGESSFAFMGIGGVTGIGSLVYALTRCAALLDVPELLAVARSLAEQISEQQISEDEQFDVMGGSAGAINALLALYIETDDATALAKAEECGRHLLNRRTRLADGCSGWSNGYPQPLTGFSHGAAGIALALLRLYEQTNAGDLLEAAQEAMAYERSVFRSESGNWPDFRCFDGDTENHSCMTTWCHGAPGIGLARNAGRLLCVDSMTEREIAITTQTTQSHRLQDVDHLCCGTIGRLLILDALSPQKGAERTEIMGKVGMIMDRAEQAGGYRLFRNMPESACNPGLFRGTAGIGYALLCFSGIKNLPNILTLA